MKFVDQQGGVLSVHQVATCSPIYFASMWSTWFRRCWFRRCLMCGFSTSSKNITIKVDSSKVAIIFLHRAPVNSLNIALCLELTQAMKDVEASNFVEAVVIKSSLPGIFSAGLDLKDLYGKPPDHLELFWKSVQDSWLQLYSSRLATVAYISGHCLAAGIIFAAACDYRFGVDGNYKLGITAARIGMVTPRWIIDVLSQIIVRRQVAYSLQTGQTFSPEEAVKVGMLDSLSLPESADADCLNILNTFLSVSQESRQTIKHYLRSDFIRDFESSRQKDLTTFVDYVMRDSVQQNIGNYLKRKN